ncbi:hypothetical protein BKI52_38025 [marine bacterium AO1-C]|nr:hypothetical protein BKI52_38025 [marine bacterium AO1-C]
MNIPHMKKVYKSLRYCWLLAVFAVISFSSVQAQIATQGAEFWFAFSPHTGATSLRVMVVSDSAANVEITMPANAAFTTINQAVPADRSTFIDIPVANITTGSAAGNTENMGFKLTSDRNVSITLLNAQTGGTPSSLDGTIVFPHNSAQDWTQSIVGNFSDYIVNTSDQSSSIVVVATVDATDVILTPSGGTATTVTLNQGQTHTITGTNSLDGYRVQACKPILVFAGGQTATEGCTVTNLMVNQMMPFETWGNRFFTVPGAGGASNYSVKIVGSTDGTTISVDSVQTTTVNKGQSVLLNGLTQPVCIETSSPVQISQFFRGNTCNGSTPVVGGPAMVVLKHVQQGVDSVAFPIDTVATTTNITNRFVTIITPDGSQNNLRLNGQAIPATSFTQYTICTDYVHATIDLATFIPSGAFSKVTVSGAQNALVYAQGYGTDKSYIYSGGYNVTKVPISASGNPNPSCTGSAIALTATGPNNIATYTWTLPDGSTQTGTNITYTVRSTADSSYSLLATNDAGCDSTISFTIPVDTIILSVNTDQVVCDSITLDAGTGFTSYAWSTGATTQTITVSDPGSYTFTVTRGACTASATINVTSGTKPEVTIGVSPAQPTASERGLERQAFICVENGETLTLTGDTTGTAQLVTWNTGATTNQITVDTAGTYIATIQFTPGCIVIDSMVVQDVCEVKFFVPTAFSPNGDGVNDNLVIFGEGFFNLDFRVFNRWGEVIYVSRSQNDGGWDGTAHGVESPNGTYVWRAIFEDVKNPGTLIKRWGRINIIR